MKTKLLLFLLLLAGNTSFAQTVPSTCVPTSQLLQTYKNDVADLALQRVYETGSPDTALIEIPQRYQDTIWQALAAVANTRAALEADSIIRNYCVHRWPQKAYKGTLIDLKVDNVNLGLKSLIVRKLDRNWNRYKPLVIARRNDAAIS